MKSRTQRCVKKSTSLFIKSHCNLSPTAMFDRLYYYIKAFFMKKLSLLASVVFFAFAAPAWALSLVMENQSVWEIHELYFAPANQESWGPDQLGNEVIKNGGSFTLSNIPANNYDVRIVDEGGDACVIEDVDFNASEHFVVTDTILARCQKATAQSEAEEE